MPNDSTRRNFLKWAAATGGAGCILTEGGFHGLPSVANGQALLPPNAVQLQPEVAPLVQLIEKTPRSQLLESVGEEIGQGTSYQSILAALMLAGVRNVQPRPYVGFKFHAVLVVNAAHLASLASPNEHRWLPIFWALDYFKTAQSQDVKENNWTMAQPAENAIPTASKCRQAFLDAMNNWDEQAADAAVAGVARHLPANEVYEMFFRYGARDYRSIGHKAIFVANSWRTLQCIGWRHAEPIVRSLAYALLNHEGDNPAKGDAEADRPWRENMPRALQFRDDWLDGRVEPDATTQMLSVLRSGDYQDASREVLKQINAGISPQAIWDAYFLDAAELLVRQPAIVAMHAVTSTNALRFAFRTTANDNTRRMILLQTAAFLTLFHTSMRARGRVTDFRIDDLEPLESTETAKAELATIFADVSNNKPRAARRLLAHLNKAKSPGNFLNEARLLMFFKGSGSHDYKFGSAVMEDYYQVSPTWRNRYLAASVFNLRGSQDSQNPLVGRAQKALGG